MDAALPESEHAAEGVLTERVERVGLSNRAKGLQQALRSSVVQQHLGRRLTRPGRSSNSKDVPLHDWLHRYPDFLAHRRATSLEHESRQTFGFLVSLLLTYCTYSEPARIYPQAPVHHAGSHGVSAVRA